MSKSLELYDSTLRDGNQAVGVSFSVEDKLRVADKLDELGMDYIEGGWPNPTNPTDREFFEKAKKRRFTAELVAFGSTRRPNTTPGKDAILKTLLSMGVRTIAIFGKSWPLQVKDVIRTTLDENLRCIESSVAYLKKRSCRVVYDAEHFFDGYAQNPDYALETLTAACDGGADRIVLCDTNGGALPSTVGSIVARVCALLPKCKIGIHTHNDSGNGVANALMAVENGAMHVQGTINGLGERCGNANLCTIIPNLALKMGRACVPAANLTKLSAVSLFVDEVANLLPDIRQPYVGECAFSHKGGAHIDGVIKNVETFEHVAPKRVGNERRYVLSDQAGRSAIVQKIKKIRPNASKGDPLVRRLLSRIKEMEHKGYQFEAAEGSFQLLAKRALGIYKELFQFKGFRVIVEKREDGQMYSEATIKVKRGREVVHTAAEGDGPVNALDNAVRKALVNFYPQLRDVRLEDFKVRVLDGRDGTEGTVRVLIESHDGKEHWGTVGVSPNIIEASWLALVDSLSYKIMKGNR